MSERCNSCQAFDTGLCGTLSAQDLDALSRLGRSRTLSPGQALLWEGEEAVVVANIKSGAVKLCILSSDGREQIVGLAQPGDFVGRLFGAQSPYSAIALGPVELCLFGQAEFEQFARNHGGLVFSLFQRTLDDLDRARRQLLLLGRGSAEQRVAALLLAFAGQDRDGGRFDLPLGRQQMADLLGLTIETVSRQLTRFKSEGVIELAGRRGVVLARADQLQALAA
ncbi:Crp/Fnr family transcriptional regulator [Sphingomonas sp. ID1715]|uniref:Crp/Fnr family transcriptional regulator n=1 Tax=Sphingomonas sp. ID1715 TaxID=1656898 RepID=UPI0014877024|nr:Crp/Fnr family transcriptional regulator [Sphingomonas sp. ID1715]NNM76439.1 Crp/Fnr family transcriptional regulator [Sphingomonas sp. ID1715]